MNAEAFMSEQGERLAVAETRIENVEDTMEDIKQRLVKVEKSLWAMGGGIVVLNALIGWWLKHT